MDDLILNLDRIRDNAQYHNLSGTIVTDKASTDNSQKLASFFAGDNDLLKKNNMDFADKFPATININIMPNSVRVSNPGVVLDNNTETIDQCSTVSFSRCRIHYDGSHFYGILYHPFTKQDQTSVVEIIAPYIPGIKPGDEVQLDLVSEEVELIKE